MLIYDYLLYDYWIKCLFMIINNQKIGIITIGNIQIFQNFKATYIYT